MNFDGLPNKQFCPRSCSSTSTSREEQTQEGPGPLGI